MIYKLFKWLIFLKYINIYILYCFLTKNGSSLHNISCIFAAVCNLGGCSWDQTRHLCATTHHPRAAATEDKAVVAVVGVDV